MINKEWDIVLKDEMKKDYFKKLGFFIKEVYKTKTCYPEYKNIFNALKFTDYDKVKVVILGQDPYHGDGEAHGLAFSVRENTPIPPSLRNILKELNNDLSIKKENSDLTGWATQGVLLLNAVMTVEKDKPLSHREKGWEIFTDNIIKYLNERKEPIIFVLWGNYAKDKKKIITNPNHFIIESAHPSPLSASRGFFNSKPFSKINYLLEKNHYQPIDWLK